MSSKNQNPDKPANCSPTGKILASSLRDVGRQMFVPEHFDFSDTDGLLAYIHANPFAQLFSSVDGLSQITATPLIYSGPSADDTDFFTPGSSIAADDSAAGDDTSHEFVGHIAKRNPQCAAVRAAAPAIALLQGPDAYISPRWYVEEPKIPTWSYVAVQLRGQFIPIEDHDETLSVLAKTINHMERDEPEPWRLEGTAPELLQQFSKGILAFRFRVSQMQGIKRLGQSRDLEDMKKVINGLSATGDSNALKIAAMMQENINNAT